MEIILALKEQHILAQGITLGYIIRKKNTL